MSNLTRKVPPNKTNSSIDQNFPPLIPNRSNTQKIPPQPVPIPKNPPQTVDPINLWKEFEAFDIKSPEDITKTDLTPQDFGYALTSSLNLIPDAPFEVDPQQLEEKKIEDRGIIYPQTPYMKLLQPEFFKKYDVLTLFFIFFYFPGTSQQFFAARELKSREWMYHKSFQTWFHRTGESTETNEQYEIGKFEYFDHSNSEGWCIRVKSNLKIEYSQIEE